jgi:hypothetical protein
MTTPDLLASVAALAPLAFLVTWVTETLKDATNKNWNGLTTRIAAYVGSFAVVSAFAHTPWAVSVTIAHGTNLSTLNWAALALVALAVTAGAGTLADSAIIPVAKKLLPGTSPTPAVASSDFQTSPDDLVVPEPAPAPAPVDHSAEIAALQAQIDALKPPA